MLSVVSNLSAMNAQRQFNITGDTIRKSTEKLSSGYKINRAADDAAGLTISEKMRSLIRGMNQGSDNIQDGISVMQIADGALAEVHGMLHRMTELSIKAANGTNTAADRQAIQSEINELSAEITRIGKTTEFNTMHILDDVTDNGGEERVTHLVSCDSADKGYISEAININGQWHSGATMNFSGVNKYNIKNLNGGGFSFHCSEACGETFDFKFVTDGTQSSVDGQNNDRGVHKYTVDVSHCRNGKEVVDTIYDYVYNHQPNNGASNKGALPGIAVSHSNVLNKTDDGYGLIVYATGTQPTKAGAETYYSSIYTNSTKSGAIDCKNLTNITSASITNRFRIQCSNITDDCEYIETYRMNANVLGVNHVDVSTELAARSSISQISDALEMVSDMRSTYGAFQNRLEHSYDNNNNKAENMTAAESRIRDTDMSTEMMKLTTANILSQAGSAMLSQTMQNPQSVLSLLQ